MYTEHHAAVDKGCAAGAKGKAGIEVSAKKNALDPDQRFVDEKKEDTRGQEVKPDAEKPLLKTPKEDISRQAKGNEDKTAKAKQQAATDSILQRSRHGFKTADSKQTGKQRLRKRHALKKHRWNKGKRLMMRSCCRLCTSRSIRSRQAQRKSSRKSRSTRMHRGSMYRNQRLRRESLVQHTSSGKSKPEQTIDLREGGATFTQAELQDILIAINTNEEESDQDTATASPA